MKHKRTPDYYQPAPRHYAQPHYRQPDIHIHNRGNRGGSMFGRLAMGGLMIGLVVAADKFDIIDLPDFPDINNILSTDPEYAIATVDQSSYELEVEFDINCREQVSVAVDVETFKNGPVGDGVMEKKIFGDFLLCSDNREIQSAAVATQDPVSGEVTDLVVELSGVHVTHPRVDHLDVRNCLDLDPGDTMTEVQEKLNEYNNKVASGEKPSCDDGFRVTQLGGTSSLAAAKDIGWKAAQLAMVVDANPAAIIAEADERLAEDVEQQLRSQTQFIGANIDVRIVRPGDTATVQQRLETVSEDLRNQFTEIRFGTNDKGDYMYVEDSSGAHATVYFTGYAELEVEELTVSDATVEPNPRFNNGDE